MFPKNFALDYSPISSTMDAPHHVVTVHGSRITVYVLRISTPMNTFHLYLFGSPRLERDGVAIKIPRRKVAALLSYLAVTGKPHARDSLATLFWPDYSQGEARVALSRHLSALNKILGNNTLVLETESVALGTNLRLDVTEFEKALAAHATVTAHNLSTVQVTVDLYTADFLAGFTLPDCPNFDNWQTFQSESLRQSLRTALEKMVWAQAATDDTEHAIATARRWLALDSLDENAHRALMQLYAHAGQQAAALRQYDQCRQLLADELGAPPAAETTTLIERIRRGELKQEDKEQAPNLLISQSPIWVLSGRLQSPPLITFPPKFFLSLAVNVS